MNDKLQKLKEQHDFEEYELLTTEAKEIRKKRAYMFLGGIHVVGKIAKTLMSQELKALEAIQTEKLYFDLGFEKFVDFLASEESPVSKSQYYERIKLLESEGEQIFDLLNEVGVAASTRKLLAAGEYDAITIEGDQIKIGEQTADLSNARLVRSLIESYADDCKRLNDENKKLSDKNEKGKKDYDRLKERLVEAEESTARVDFTKNPIEKQNSIALGGLAALADELSRATLIECNAFCDGNLRLLATQYNRIQEILCEKLALESADELLLNDSDEDRMTALLDDED